VKKEESNSTVSAVSSTGVVFPSKAATINSGEDEEKKEEEDEDIEEIEID
jgi:hypothetical protein